MYTREYESIFPLDAFLGKKTLFLSNFKITKKLIELKQNKSIAKFTTFGVPIKAEYFTVFKNLNELRYALKQPVTTHLPRLILGGGSNLLFTKDFDGLVLKNNIKSLIPKENGVFLFRLTTYNSQ